MSNYSTMNGPQLVTAFNLMANSQLGKELNAKPVTRFSTTAAGVKRCEQLESSIRARGNGLAQADNQPQPKTAPAPAPTGIFAEFKTNPRKNRGKLLGRLAESMNAQVSVDDLLTAVYGSSEAEYGPLTMVIKGLMTSINRDSLPYKVVKEKGKGQISYGLYSTE